MRIPVIEGPGKIGYNSLIQVPILAPFTKTSTVDLPKVHGRLKGVFCSSLALKRPLQ